MYRITASIIYRMSVQHLPLVLEKAIASAIETETLQSWNIYGKEKGTVITMRFSMEAMMENTMDIKYKRTSKFST